jgi:hypothetical protein
MNKVTITGPAAELKWSYRSAARLGSWSITGDGTGGGTLTAQTVSVDQFGVSQQPLTFVVPRPNGLQWRWSVNGLQIAGSTLTASLRPQE